MLSLDKWRFGWHGWVMATLCGVAMALNQPPFYLPIGLFGLAFAIWLMAQAQSVRSAALLGWGMGLGYFALTLHWIVEPFLVDAPRHGWMAPFALLFMASGLALFWGLAGAMAASLRPGKQRLVALALALALVEWLRGTILTGFAWLPIGFMLSHGPGGALLAVWGPYGASLLTTGLAAALVAGLAYRKQGWREVLPLTAFVAIIFLSLAFGLRPEIAQEDPPLIRLVQPNAPQHLKWQPGHRERFFARAVDLSKTETGAEPDLILWPESAIPAWLNHAAPQIAEISEAAQAPVLAGIRHYEGTRFFNSAVLIEEASATARYDKHHLVPFGEYIPFGALLSRFGIYGLAAEEGGGYSPGPGPTILQVDGIGDVRVLICYEAVFPQHSRLSPRPVALANLTNDAWFGGWAGPVQHLAHARARALEQGLPMIRAANTGISAIIAPNGKILTEIPLGQAGQAQALLPNPTQPTLYSQTGDWPILSLILVAFVALWVIDRRKLH